MGDFLEKVWVEFSHSTKTQLAITLGLISFISGVFMGCSLTLMRAMQQGRDTQK